MNLKTIMLTLFILTTIMVNKTYAMTIGVGHNANEYKDINTNQMIGESIRIEKPKEVKRTHGYSENDILLLARIINAEAKGEPFRGKVAVGNIVLNRVKSNEFPDTIRGVIYQPRQFQPVSNGAINDQPSKESIRAAYRSLEVNVVGDALYFYNPYTSTDSWITTRRVTMTIGKHSFAI